MSITPKWRQHIEAWKRSGLSQAQYCAEQQINVGTFAARLSEYRKSFPSDTEALIPVQVKPAINEPITFIHTNGHRLELPASVSVQWVAELLLCLA